jgi:hypothetical protein
MTTQFKRGEIRALSIQIVEKNSAEPFETVVDLTAEAFGWQKAQARTHVRWLVREGLVNKTPGIEAWPKRARKEKTAETKVKAKSKTTKTKSKSTKVAKKTEAVAETTVQPKADTGVKNGMNKSMADLAAKFMKFKEKADADKKVSEAA